MVIQRRLLTHSLCTLAIVSFSVHCLAQKAHACHIDYEDQNQIDYKIPNRVGVKGSITDPSSKPVPNACVAIFTENGHRFVVGRTSDSKGEFDLPLLRNGAYRLLIRADGFGAANVKFVKAPETRADSRLHAHMLPESFDTTSYIDTK